MRKKWFWIIVVSLLTLIGLPAPAVRNFRRGLDRAFASDAVLCISLRISNLYEENPSPSPEEIEKEIRVLHDASITSVFLDNNRKPVDRWGTPFQIRREVSGKPQTVTATSAGPDRKFKTEDDIAHTTTAQATR